MTDCTQCGGTELVEDALGKTIRCPECAGQPDPVAEARKMLDGVTPGPWAPDGEDQGSAWGMAWSVSRAENILDCVADAVDAEETARFIAWTREGVPALLDTIEALQAEVARLRDLISWAYETLREINPSNYNHDDVCNLNYACVEVIIGLAPIVEGGA